MLLLGEQLITDEIAALSELIKNSYDADAKKVRIELKGISNKKISEVVITDNGHGMARSTLLESWLELGTISKVTKPKKKRYSEELHRPYLGEKGLGRLAIHKIGQMTEITTRRKNAKYETSLFLDWSQFKDLKKFLDQVEVEWEENTPTVFVKDNKDFPKGTRIKITELHRDWTRDMVRDMRQFVSTIKSPFSSLKDFDIELIVQDRLVDVHVKTDDMDTIFKTANYYFEADIDKNGSAEMSYSFKSKVYPEWNRTNEYKKDLKQYDAKYFEGRDEIECGPFRFVIYCWDLDPKEKKESFDETITYAKSVKPLVGIKVFRDGFRVLPYGNPDNDWLSMDRARIGRFQENVSRSQVIGYVEINSRQNPSLVDKSDREGLIDNDQFQDFKSLVKCALQFFQVERNKERLKIKAVQREDARVKKLKSSFSNLTSLLDETNISTDVKEKIHDTIFEIKKTIDRTLEDLEEPLLAAAALGLTYMIPTHEAEREIQNSYNTLNDLIRGTDKNPFAKIKTVIKQLHRANEVLQGIVKLSQTTKDEERFWIKEPIEFVIEIMRNKAKRENIEVVSNMEIKKTTVGAQRLYEILLLNLIDNSMYWLKTQKNTDRKIKISFIDYDRKYDALIVSDNGPGLEDELEFITNPFVTRKTKGMGLGLYICDRIARNHKGKLKSFDEFDHPGLLSGANIGFLIPKA